MRVIIVFALFLTLLSKTTHADWGQGGAAYKCDPSANLFVLEATMSSSADEQIFFSPGFTSLSQKSNPISCLLDGAPIEATILIGEPQARGMCGAIGQVAINHFRIDNTVLLPIAQVGSPCRDIRGIVRLEVQLKDRVATVKKCTGVWDWSPKYLDIECETSKVTTKLRDKETPGH